jgi:hypothetical protein
MSGIYAGDGEQFSLAATFLNLWHLEREYGRVTRGLLQGGERGGRPTVPPPCAVECTIWFRPRRPPCRHQNRHRRPSRRFAVQSGARTTNWSSPTATRFRRGGRARDAGIRQPRRGVARPAARRSPCGDPLRIDRRRDTGVPIGPLRLLDGYGYVVPGSRDSMSSRTWTSSKWQGRAPAASLVRVYIALRDQM